MSNLASIALFVQVILQLVAAILCFSAWRRKHYEYLFYIMLALSVMVLRRITAILDLLNLFPSVELLDKVVLPLAITILMVKGIHGLSKYGK